MTPGPRHAPGQNATPTAGPELPTSSPSTGTWEVKVFDAPGGQARTLRCTDLSRGGMFLHTEGAVPPMFARFKVALVLPDGEFPLKAEVVRHVTVDQSRAWNMPVGFGVQFIELTPAQRDDLANLARGLPRFQSAAQRAEEKDDSRAEEVLGPWLKRLSGSHYELLRAADDIDFPEVRHLVRDARKALEALANRPLSARQRDQLEAVERRFDLAMTALGQPRNRLDYDAGRANWKGVSRCIAGGVSVSELDAARARYLELHPRVEGNAHLHFTTGSAWESQSVLDRALAEFEKALMLDPLNLAYHQRYQAARRSLRRPS
jgi:serine/threonine-protein kinase